MNYRIRFYIGCSLFCIALCMQSALAQAQRALQIQVTGIEDPLKKNAELTLDNIKNKMEHPLNQRKVAHFMNEAPKFIKSAIAPYGYFHPVILSQLSTTPTGWLTQFAVKKGPPVIISHFSVTVSGPGKSDPWFKNYLAKLPLKEGDILKTEKYESIKSTLFQIASRHGYFDVSVRTSEIKINLNTNQASIIIHVATGHRFRVGKITFSKSKFHQKFLEAFLRFHTGEFYNADKIEETQQEMATSNFFNQVLIKPAPSRAKNRLVPIHIELAPRTSQEYTFGLGYGTETKFRGTVGMTIRNIGDWGQKFKMLVRGSQDDNNSFTMKYFIPGTNPARDLWTISTGMSNIHQANGSAKNGSFSVGYTRDFGRWSSTAALTYLNETYTITTLPKTNTQMVYPTLTINYLNSDHPISPTKGVSFSIQFAGALKELFSRASFSQVTTHFNALYTLKKTHTRFILRTGAGYTNIESLGELPLSLQLMAGGERSVRGFSYNSIGPGRNLLVASAEVQQRVYKEWYLAGFVDTALVGNQHPFSELNIGVGPGIVWLTPVGAVELTIANAITQASKPWLIQFSMGTIL